MPLNHLPPDLSPRRSRRLVQSAACALLLCSLMLLATQARAQRQGPPTSAPTLSVTPGKAKIKLTWSTVSGDVTHYVYYRSENGGPATGPGFSNTSPAEDTYLLHNGSTYTYYVQAVNYCGVGPASNTATARLTLDAPTITATPGPAKITVSRSTVPDADSHVICWEDAHDSTNHNCFSLDNATSTEIYSPGFPFHNGGTYLFYGIARNQAGDSPRSAVVPVSLNLAAPKGVVAKLNPDGQVTVSWQAVPDATRYSVVRAFSDIAPSPYPGWSNIGFTEGTTITDQLVYTDVRYYQVVAHNDAGDGPGSYIARTGAGADETCECRVDGMIPLDHPGAGNPWGPKAHDPVNLATGREDYQLPPDLSVYNPAGPAVAWRRSYYGSRALKGYASPGLSDGWVHNYDVTLRAAPGAWGALTLTYEAGSIEALTPVLDGGGQPTGVLTPPAGSSYFVRGVAGASAGVWQSVTVTWKDRTQWRFTPLAGDTYVLSRITNRTGQSVDLTWNGLRALTQMADAASGAPLLSFAYGSDGRLVSVTDAYDRQVVYGYDAPFGSAPGRLQSVSQVVPAGTPQPPARWTFTYEADLGQQLRTITVPSPTGTGTQTAVINYDTAGRVKSLVDANNNERVYTYQTGSTVVEVKNAAGNVVQAWAQKFNADRRDTGVTDAGDKSTTFEYNDPQNPTRPTKFIDKNGKVTTYTYDAFGNVQTMTTPRGVTTVYTWDYAAFPLGRLRSVKEGTKPATTFDYHEPSGLLAGVTMPALNSGSGTVTSSFTYDALGNVLTATTPGNNATGSRVTTYNYTTDGTYTQAAKVGQPLTVADSLGHKTHMRYDAQGRVTSVTDAEGHTTEASYNLLGQSATVTLPATNQTGPGRGRIVSGYLYTGGPLITTTTYDESDTQVRQVTRSYGPEGELCSVAGSTELVAYTYDALYRLKTLADGKNNTTTYSYNAVGYLERVQMPGGESVQFTSYDAAGHLLERTDGNNVTTTYRYEDPENLLTDIEYPTPALNVHFGYDGFGRRNAMTDATGSHSYSYGHRDELLSHTTTYTGLPAQAIGYGYYPDSSRQTMTTPVGGFLYSYDAAGRMTGLTNPYGETTAWTYYDNNWLHTQHLYNSLHTTYSYNARGQLTRLLNEVTVAPVHSDIEVEDPDPPAAPVVLSDYSRFAYDGAGNRQGLTASVPAVPGLIGATTYQYDLKDQLKEEQTSRGGGFTDVFDYDAAGNPTTFRGATKSYNANNQQTGSGFVHDNNGNPTAYGGVSLTFDPENRLTAYGTTLTAGYTGDGLRAWKQTAQGRVYYLYDGVLPLMEIGAGNTRVIRPLNTYGAAGLVSRVLGPEPQVGGARSEYYAFDPQGSVTVRLDAGGHTLATSDYRAHGAALSGGGGPWGFGAQWGYQADAETGLQLLTHRYYDPQSGRFLTRDPISYAGGINLYAYVQNQPIGFIDPLGTQRADISPREVAEFRRQLDAQVPPHLRDAMDKWHEAYERCICEETAKAEKDIRGYQKLLRSDPEYQSNRNDYGAYTSTLLGIGLALATGGLSASASALIGAGGGLGFYELDISGRNFDDAYDQAVRDGYNGGRWGDPAADNCSRRGWAQARPR